HYKTGYTGKYWQLLFIGLFLDELYGVPLGVNSTSFIIANIMLSILHKQLAINKYVLHLSIMCFYTFVIEFARIVIMYKYSMNHIAIFALIFQYLTTIFIYPVLHKVLDKLFERFKDDIQKPERSN